MKKPELKVEIKPETKVEIELEKVEILTRFFHGVSLESLKRIEHYLLPRGKNCETISR